MRRRVEFYLMCRGIAAAIIAVTMLTQAGCERWALDRQMEQLCRKDGGVKVYEKVMLPASYFDTLGEIKLGPSMPWGVSLPKSRSHFRHIGNDEYRVVTEITYLIDGDPMKGEGRLERAEHRLIRTSDQKVLAVAVSYGRSGGDLVAYGHPSSKSCPVSTKDTSVESAIVKKDE